MRRLILLLSAFLIGAPAASQEWRTAPEYDVLLTSWAIQPKVLRLKAGEPVRLRFVNNSNEPHRFAAPGFFGTAELRERDRPMVRGGSIAVPPLSEATIVLVPRAGHYRMNGGGFAQRALGMHGRIVVDQEAR
jgi:plastocyanin